MEDLVINLAITISGGKATVQQVPSDNQTDPFLNMDAVLKEADMGMSRIVNGKAFSPTPDGLRMARRELLKKKMREYHQDPVIALARRMKNG